MCFFTSDCPNGLAHLNVFLYFRLSEWFRPSEQQVLQSSEPQQDRSAAVLVPPQPRQFAAGIDFMKLFSDEIYDKIKKPWQLQVCKIL
jgi:hypothetical protein